MFRFAARSLRSAAAASAAAAVQPTPTDSATVELEVLSPRKITEILDRYIIGQDGGKKAVAIALRNRWRRRQLKDTDLQKEVVPKNMLLIGPTGVGKTEISRRMAKITDAPFIKVEATKYTEVGFKGKDVEGIIEDLYTNAKTKARKRLEKERQSEALRMALDSVYTSWAMSRRLVEMQPAATSATATAAKPSVSTDEQDVPPSAAAPDRESIEYFTQHYKEEPICNHVVTIEVAAPQPAQKPFRDGAPTMQSVGLFLGLSSEPQRPKMSVTKRVVEAIPLALQEALDKLIDEASVNAMARALAEEEGVVFIDEIDKVVAEPSSSNADVSSTGVQQDLLPLVEGSNVTMKDGSVIATDNILFICSGAFHVSKTSDMIAELQGRLPVRVELQPLTETDLRRILTEPRYNLLLQQKEMMKTENIDIVFTPDGIDELAKVTCSVNTQGQNIGARRLHAVLERVMDTYSFGCEDYEGKTVEIDSKVVKDATEKLQKNINLAKYLL